MLRSITSINLYFCIYLSYRNIARLWTYSTPLFCILAHFPFSYRLCIKAVLINLVHSNASKPQKVDSSAFISGNSNEGFSI